MIHVIEFFGLSNNNILSTSLAIAFELGAAASLASIIVLDKMNKYIVWSLFVILTAMQMMGNSFYAYVHLHDFKGWVELFGLQDMEAIEQRRILSIVSGAILPIVALGFIKALVDYIKPPKEKAVELQTEQSIIKHNDDNKPEIDSVKSDDAIDLTDNANINETPEIVFPKEFNVPEEDHKVIEKTKEDNILSEVNTKDPSFVKLVNEYINKTRGVATRHPKTTPGVG
jgi:hypothetical protein